MLLLKQYIRVFPEAFSLKTVSTIIKVASNLKFEKATIGRGELNEQIRKVNHYQLNPRNKSLTEVHWCNFLRRKFFDYMEYYLTENKLLDFYKLHDISQIDILKYEETFHYKYHVDDGITSKRALSCILFLNNDYEGGELSFKNTFNDEEINLQPQPGALVVWPSNFLFPHTVKPIRKGTRYSVVGWGH
jgi:predicted 2-oxoglutarate/Fe(II)-dependent dioxygenase YbiX